MHNEDIGNAKHFTDWLENYQQQKLKLSMRQARAKENHNMILTENLNRWSEAISKKSQASKPVPGTPFGARSKVSTSPSLFRTESVMSRASISEGSKAKDKENSFERVVRSAYINAKLSGTEADLKKRPKSVSFSLNSFNNAAPASIKMRSPIKERSFSVENSEQPKPIIHIQPTYLVSQIEMEEILKESETRSSKYEDKMRRNQELIRQKNVSSVSFADIVEIDTDSDCENFLRKIERQQSALQSRPHHATQNKSNSAFSMQRTASKSASSNQSSGYKSKSKTISEFFDDSCVSTNHR